MAILQSDPYVLKRGIRGRKKSQWKLTAQAAWYTDNVPSDDTQVATHFSSKRPIVGLSLKRYTMLQNGVISRLNTHVDIPTEIGLPHFIQDDSIDTDVSIYGNFKLSLQAFVCHRGNSVNSGHYIAIVRGTSAGATPLGSSSSSSRSVDDPSRYWMRFDDMAQERVTLVDVEKALETESPYLLFYQILPVNQDAAEANLKLGHASSPSSTGIPEADLTAVTQSLHTLSTEGSSSDRPSVEVTAPDESGPPTPVANERRAGAVSESAVTANDTLKPNGSKRSINFGSRSRMSRRSNPGSRDGSQKGVNDGKVRRSLSRLRVHSRDKTGDEFSGEDLGDRSRIENVEAKTPSTDDEKSDVKGTNRLSKDRGRSRNRPKEKSRDRTSKNPDRECVVM